MITITMKQVVTLCCFIVATAALPIESFVDEDGQQFVLLPLQRERRDLTWGANSNGFSLGQKGTIYSNSNHQFDGSYGASKAWGSHGIKPDTFGGRVDYTHNPSGSSAFVGANRTPGWGTDLAAGGKYNIAQGKNWNVDVTGQYGRHYGGPIGTGKPEYGAFLNVNGRF
ncbi:uncharacterized protein [Diabrotica undecimpunctata]|uniref:uncharacterized protein n=1 Tax=Diabrotica undecimpunctata TaxID=50387 RepID=UPI003B63FD00